MSALRFRAILIDPGNRSQERPVQIFGNDRTEIDKWAGEVLSKAIASTAHVNVYETVETLVHIVQKPAEPKA